MVRRIVIAAVALLAGLAVAGGLLLYDRAGQTGAEVYVAAVDLPAGAHLGGGAARLVRAVLDARQAALAYRAGEEGRLGATVAAHDLTAGQIIQRSDTVLAGHDVQRALVVLSLKEAPPLRAGDRIDLLSVAGTGENVVVTLFAPAVEVHAVGASGVVVSVGAAQAPGFVYAGAALRLVAVLVPNGARPAEETSVNSAQQARVVARR